MGNFTSKLSGANALKEYFMVYYLCRTGPTPYTLELLPGGCLKETDDDAMVRHKFKMALRKQAQLSQILNGIERKVTRCLSPCLMADFSLEGSLKSKQNMYNYTWEEEPDRSRSVHVARRGRGTIPSQERHRSTSKSGSKRGGLGNLNRLITSSQFPEHRSSEEIVAYDVVKPLKGSLKEKRARSRPEPASRSASKVKRLAMSDTKIGSPSVHQVASEVIVEKIELGGRKSKKTWPSKEVLKNLNDPKTCPTTFFLAQFRYAVSPELLELVEVEYHYNELTQEELFSCRGALDSLLSEEERCKYHLEQFNNNLDEKAIFLKNAPYIFNHCDTRLFWNGFLMNLSGGESKRMRVKSIEMSPPAIVFDMKGLQRISASRNYSKLSLNGANAEGDGASKLFVIRGKTDNDVKKITISHLPGTLLVKVGFPLMTDTISNSTSCVNEEKVKIPVKGILKETSRQ